MCITIEQNDHRFEMLAMTKNKRKEINFITQQYKPSSTKLVHRCVQGTLLIERRKGTRPALFSRADCRFRASASG